MEGAWNYTVFTDQFLRDVLSLEDLEKIEAARAETGLSMPDEDYHIDIDNGAIDAMYFHIGVSDIVSIAHALFNDTLNIGGDNGTFIIDITSNELIKFGGVWQSYNSLGMYLYIFASGGFELNQLSLFDFAGISFIPVSYSACALTNCIAEIDNPLFMHKASAMSFAGTGINGLQVVGGEVGVYGGVVASNSVVMVSQATFGVYSVGSIIINAPVISDKGLWLEGKSIAWVLGESDIQDNTVLKLLDESGTILFDEGAKLYTDGLEISTIDGSRIAQMDIASSMVVAERNANIFAGKINIFAKDTRVELHEADNRAYPHNLKNIGAVGTSYYGEGKFIKGISTMCYRHGGAGACANFFGEKYFGKAAASFVVNGEFSGEVGELYLAHSIFKAQSIKFDKDDTRINIVSTTLNKRIRLAFNCIYYSSECVSHGSFKYMQTEALHHYGMHPHLFGNLEGVRVEFIEPYDYVKSTFYVENFVGNRNIIHIGGAPNLQGNFAIADRAALQSKLNQITGGRVSNSDVTQYEQAQDIAYNAQFASATADPDRAVKFEDQYRVPGSNTIPSSNLELNNAGNMLGGGVKADYIFIEKFPPAFECSETIETLISKLGFLPEDYIKLCPPTCMQGLIKQGFFSATGLSNLADFDPGLKQFFIDKNLNTRERECAELQILINNAIEQSPVLNLKLGEALSASLQDSFSKPFVWLIYRSMSPTPDTTMDVLVPVIYFPKAYIAGSPGFMGGATMMINHITGNIEALSNSGTFLVSKGQAEIGKLLNTNLIVKVGSEDLTVTVGQLLSTSVVGHQIGESSINSQRQSYAQIQAIGGGNLNINVGVAILQGTEIKTDPLSGSKINFNAKNIAVIPSHQISALYYNGANGYYISASLFNILSEIAGNVNFKTEGTAIFIGADGLKANQISVTSEQGQILYTVAVNQHYQESLHIEEDEDLFSSETITTFNQQHTQWVAGNQFGSKDLPMRSFTSVSYQSTTGIGLVVHSYALEIKAGADANQAEINLLPAYTQNYYSSWVKSEKSGFLGFEGLKVVTQKNHFVSDVNANIDIHPSELHYYGTDDATIAANGDINIISSKLHAPNGGNFNIDSASGNVNLDAAYASTIKYHGEKTSKTTFGFTVNFHEVTGGVEHKVQNLQGVTINLVPVPTQITVENLHINAPHGNFFSRGAILEYRDLVINAQSVLDMPAFEKMEESHKQFIADFALKAGFYNNVANAVDSTRALIEHEGEGAVGAINKGFLAYGAVVDWMKAYVNPIGFDITFSAQFKQNKLYVNSMTAISSQYRSRGNTTINAVKVEMHGSKIMGLNWQINCKEALFASAFSSYEVAQDDKSAGFSIGLLGMANALEAGNAMSFVLNPSASINVGKYKYREHGNQPVMFEAYLSGDFELNAEGTVKFEGTIIDAAKLKLNVGQLIVRSVQEIIKIHGEGVNLGISSDLLVNKIEPWLKGKGLGGSIGFETRRGDTAWINEMSQLLGREQVEIIVNGMLEISASMIANAELGPDGRYIDRGRLSIKALEVLVENVWSYDKGHLLGASLNIPKEKGGVFGNRYGFDVGYKDLEKLTRATIGRGNIEVLKGAVNEINRDVNAADGETEGVNIDEIHGFYKSMDIDKFMREVSEKDALERIFETLYKAAEFLGIDINAIPVPEQSNEAQDWKSFEIHEENDEDDYETFGDPDYKGKNPKKLDEIEYDESAYEDEDYEEEQDDYDYDEYDWEEDDKEEPLKDKGRKAYEQPIGPEQGFEAVYGQVKTIIDSIIDSTDATEPEKKVTKAKLYMVFQAGNAMPPELQAAFWQQLINYSQVNEAGFDWWDELNIFSAREANAAAPAIAFYMAGVAEGVIAAIETCLASGACVRGLATIARLFAAKENLENLEKDKDKYTKEQKFAKREGAASTGTPDPNNDDWEPDDEEWKVERYDEVQYSDKHQSKYYRDPEAVSENGNRLWWTKDTAKHGGHGQKSPSTWKVYEETNEGLRHYKDVDKYGNYIHGKHKGPVGQVIEWKDLRAVNIKKAGKP